MRGIICGSLLGLGLIAQGLAARPAAADVSITIGVPVYVAPPRSHYPPSSAPTYVAALPPHWYAPPRYVAVPLPAYPYRYYAPPHRHQRHGRHG